MIDFFVAAQTMVSDNGADRAAPGDLRLDGETMTNHVEGYRAALEAAGAIVESFESSGTDLTGVWAATVSYRGKRGRISGRYFASWEHDELLYCFGADWRERLDHPEAREQFIEFGRDLLART